MNTLSERSSFTLPLLDRVSQFRFIINFINQMDEIKTVDFVTTRYFEDVILSLFDRFCDPLCRFTVNPFNSDIPWSHSISCPVSYVINKSPTVLCLQINLFLESYSFEEPIEDFLNCMHHYKSSLISSDKINCTNFLTKLFTFFPNY